MAHDPHVIKKQRDGGTRHGEVTFYAVGWQRSTRSAAREDLHRFLAEREAQLQAQLHRALGEGAGLREALEELGRDPCDACGLGDGRHSGLCEVGKALAASPLSKLAGEVLGAVYKELSLLDNMRGQPDYDQGDARIWHSLAWDAVEPSVREFVDTLRVELDRGHPVEDVVPLADAPKDALGLEFKEEEPELPERLWMPPTANILLPEGVKLEESEGVGIRRIGREAAACYNLIRCWLATPSSGDDAFLPAGMVSHLREQLAEERERLQ